MLANTFQNAKVQKSRNHTNRPILVPVAFCCSHRISLISVALSSYSVFASTHSHSVSYSLSLSQTRLRSVSSFFFLLSSSPDSPSSDFVTLDRSWDFGGVDHFVSLRKLETVFIYYSWESFFAVEWMQVWWNPVAQNPSEELGASLCARGTHQFKLKLLKLILQNCHER